jgi:hypothetical protein
MILRSPKNFRGTRLGPNYKAVCMLGLGAATYVPINLKTVLADCKIMMPAVIKLSNCITVKEVTNNIAAPDEYVLIGFEGCSFLIPTPVLHISILISVTGNPFELIPIIMQELLILNMWKMRL